jgi:hypothetical protein
VENAIAFELKTLSFDPRTKRKEQQGDKPCLSKCRNFIFLS